MFSFVNEGNDYQQLSEELINVLFHQLKQILRKKEDNWRAILKFLFSY